MCVCVIDRLNSAWGLDAGGSFLRKMDRALYLGPFTGK